MKDECIRFGDIREYCSRIDRVSICELESMRYENYERIGNVPETYNSLYLYGFGMIDSEFREEDLMCLRGCIEFMLSKRPRSEIEREDEEEKP